VHAPRLLALVRSCPSIVLDYSTRTDSLSVGTAKWFNEPGVQRPLYKYYLFLMLAAQFFGWKHGRALQDSKQQ
jgi:hypothetical protein